MFHDGSKGAAPAGAAAPKGAAPQKRGFNQKALSLAAFVLTCLLMLGHAAGAATFTVTKTADTSDGVCNADCSLREAFIAANAAAGDDSITLPAGTYTLTRTGNDGNASLGDLDVNTNGKITVNGAGAASTFIQAGTTATNGIDRVFEVLTNGKLDLAGLTVRNGKIVGNGGALFLNTGAIANVQNCVVSNNSATNVGGAVYNNQGTLISQGSTFSNNSASFVAGAIFCGSATLTMDASTLNNNTSPDGGALTLNTGTVTLRTCTLNNNSSTQGQGGAIDNAANLLMQNCTLSQNTATIAGYGGAILNYATLTLQSCTLALNTASPGQGLQIWNQGATVNLGNTILFKNGASGGNVGSSGGSIISQGYNLSDDSTGATGGTDLRNVSNILLDTSAPNNGLHDNGGSTQTHALLTGSAAIDRGKSTLTTDQRGQTRPYDFPALANASGGNGSDVGAYEVQPPPNSAPVAYDKSWEIEEDGQLTDSVTATDGDNDALTYSVVNQPANGQLLLYPWGLFVYVPNHNFNGADTFTYKANDGKADSNTATVTIVVDPANDSPTANDGSITTDKNVAVSGTVSGSDIDGDPFLFNLQWGAMFGTVELAADGNFTYTPAHGFHGDDAFYFYAYDFHGGVSELATETIHVNQVNAAPVAYDGNVETNEDTSLTGLVLGIDADNDELTFSLVGDASHGAVAMYTNGSFAYVPNHNFNGTDSFTFKVNDGTVDSNTATMYITVYPVNDPPVVDDVNLTLDEDTGALGYFAAQDVDGNLLTYEAASNPSHGYVELYGDGSFAYVPNRDFNGDDSFDYTVSDGHASGTATVHISVTPRNDAPVAYGYQTTSYEDLEVGGTLTDSDADGDHLTYRLSNSVSPAHGTTTLDQNGNFLYTPNANYNGSDSFNYVVSDGALETEGSVSIEILPVADPPVADDGAVTTDEDTSVNGQLSATDADGDAVNYYLVAAPVHGTASVSSSGAYTYTPNANFNGDDVFVFAAYSNFALISNFAVITVTVNSVNDAPVAIDLPLSSNQGSSGSRVLASNDADGDVVTYSKASDPAHGTATVTSAGLATYTPAPGYVGTDSFTYKVNDGTVDSNLATISVTVLAVNHAPVASDGTLTTNAGSAANGNLTANDADGDALTFSKASNPTHGTVTVNANGSYTYTPAGGYSGGDSFTFKANDGKVDSNIATITITVVSVNTAPVAVNDTATTTVATAVAGNVLLNDNDAQGDVLTATVVTSPAGGELEFNADGTYIYTPALGFVGNVTFTYRTNDGSLNSNVATVTISVTQPANTLGAKVTGGGTVVGKNGGRATFNLNPQVDKKDGTIKGKLDYSDSQGGVFIKSTTIATLVLTPTQFGMAARITGTCTLNGAGSYFFVVDVVDNGEPGDADTYQIRLGNGFNNGPRTLDGGNIQVR